MGLPFMSPNSFVTLLVLVATILECVQKHPYSENQDTEICGQLIDYWSFKCAIQFIYHDHIVKLWWKIMKTGNVST